MARGVRRTVSAEWPRVPAGHECDISVCARCANGVNGGAKLVQPGGAKLVHLTLCGTRSEAAREVPVGPPGQPLHRRLSRYFWGFPPFLALVETIALAVHFQDMDMVGEAVQQSPGQAFRAEYLRPLIERQVGRSPGSSPARSAG